MFNKNLQDIVLSGNYSLQNDPGGAKYVRVQNHIVA